MSVSNNAKITNQQISGQVSSKRDPLWKMLPLLNQYFLCLGIESVSTFKHTTISTHLLSPQYLSHTHIHTHTHSLSQPITHAVWFLNGRLATSDQPSPFFVVLQVEGPARSAVLHRQRIGAHGQRLCFCKTKSRAESSRLGVMSCLPRALLRHRVSSLVWKNNYGHGLVFTGTNYTVTHPVCRRRKCLTSIGNLQVNLHIKIMNFEQVLREVSGWLGDVFVFWVCLTLEQGKTIIL